MTTASARAYESIKDALVRGLYLPGRRLKEDELTSLCGVSRTPVREALRRLAAEGLVVVTPNAGAQVAALDAAALEEIYALRAMLEAHAAARAATRIQEDEIVRLAELASEMERLEADACGDRQSAYARANAEFHRRILEAAESPRLTAMANLVIELPLSLRTFSRYLPEERLRSMRHHRELLDAFRARDPRWAAATMTSHVHAASKALLRPKSPEADRA